MGLQITLNTSAPFSATEVSILKLLIDSHASVHAEVETRAAAQTEKKAAPAKKAAAKKTAAPAAAPEPEKAPEVEEDTSEPSNEDILNELAAEALTVAQTLLKAGRSAEVKAALAEIGAPKVSDIRDAAKIRQFLEMVA